MSTRVVPVMVSLTPPLWRFVVVAICTLILCSCRGPYSNQVPTDPSGGGGTLPPEAFAGIPPAAMTAPGVRPLGPPGMEQGVPLPYAPAGPWAPPGIAQPWPQDEYLADGGDRGIEVAVTADKQIKGLEMEDAVATYDTVEGRTLVEPANRVFLYSPRFCAVRQVVGIRQNEQLDRTVGVSLPVLAAAEESRRGLGLHKQNEQSVGQVGQKSLTTFRMRQGDGAISTAISARGFQDAFLPYEDLEAIRAGALASTEMVRLIEGTTAAIAWSHTQGVKVILDRQSAAAATRTQQVETIFTVDLPPARPKLRIIKVASTQFAEPGDTVDFTLRFDNVGNQTIRHVVIVDNLTTRLEYVQGTTQSSVPTQFSSSENEGGSLVLRWEVTDALEPGKGGIVRFTCRVR